MKRALIGGLSIVVAVLFTATSFATAAPTWEKKPKGFEHGIALNIDGQIWYFDGPGSMPGAMDIPGHAWVQGGNGNVVGKHYNVGPNGAASWWATMEPDGVLLYMVHGIIGPMPSNLSPEKAAEMKAKGYVHFHELVDASGMYNQMMVVYLKHTAVLGFYFDGGPAPGLAHYVDPGVDYDFIPNW